MIYSLWPTNIYSEYISIDPWLPAVQQLLPEDSQLRSWADIRPWASSDLLHETPEFTDLAELILKHSEVYAHSQGLLWESLTINSMWVNAGYQHQNHSQHIHPNSWISGVVYLQVPEGSSSLIFTDPRPAAVVQRSSLHDQGIQGFQPRTGDIFLWPSWLYHGTHSHTVEELAEPRISLAFNIGLHRDIQDHSARCRL